jgi:hypothetical protein
MTRLCPVLHSLNSFTLTTSGKQFLTILLLRSSKSLITDHIASPIPFSTLFCLTLFNIYPLEWETKFHNHTKTYCKMGKDAPLAKDAPSSFISKP